MTWKLTVKTVGGGTVCVEFDQPQDTTVLDLKKKIHNAIPAAVLHLQRLALQDKTVLDQDGQKLTSYTGLRDGAIIFLIIRTPFKLYIQHSLGKLYEITIPSQAPEAYTIAQLRALVEQTTAQRLDELQFQLKGKVVEECRHGRQLTLQDCGIKKEDTLFLMKVGFVLDITDPMVDVCFLVDCSGSMGDSIESVKNNIKQLRNRLDTQYHGCDLQFAFVRYTDYDVAAHSRCSFINFTKSVVDFHRFVGAIVASGGGGDGPEDVMGGMRIVFSQLSWRKDSSKVLIHIADYPCHGRQYHDCSGDFYPNGDPVGTTHEEMMKEVAKLNIQYWFGYIDKRMTDKMISVFNNTLKQLSDHQLLIRQFEAVSSMQVGEAVHRSVAASVFAVEARKKLPLSRSTIATSPDIPNWSLMPEQLGMKTPAPGVKTVQSLQDGLTLEPPCIPIRIKRASLPFTEGNESFVYHGLDASSNISIVLKDMKTKDSSLDGYMKALEVQTIASAYAREFNCDKRKPSSVSPIDFPPVDIVDMQDSAHTCYILQKFIEGTFEKFNTNSGIVCSRSPVSDALQAFSHFTYVKSGQSLLICDLQGVQTPSGTTQLLDPAIHSKIGTNHYGPTDLGYRGIERFFRTHRCTNTCVQMGLETVK